MYNGMYWNDIQLIFPHIHTSLFASIDACFTQHTKWNYSRRSVNGTAWPVLAFSHTACVSCLHKNVELQHRNNTYMLHQRSHMSSLCTLLLSPCFWDTYLFTGVWVFVECARQREGASPHECCLHPRWTFCKQQAALPLWEPWGKSHRTYLLLSVSLEPSELVFHNIVL